jgi:glucokinase
MAAALPVIAVDLGGTQIRAGLVEDHRIVHRRALPTASERGVDAVIATMIETIRQVGAAAGRTGLPVGIASPGPLDPRSGVIFEAPNLAGWYDVPLGDRLKEALRTPVFVGNDANCAALGEYQFGAGRGVRHLCYITVSTGIGGGIISDGIILDGVLGAAGEVGHMTLDLAGPRCSCGNVGCWEALASGTAIAAQARTAIEQGELTSMPAIAATASEGRITAGVVAEAARRGDPLAVGIMRRAGTVTGHGLVNLAHLFDPELLILGGGVMHAGDLILEPAQAVFDTYAMPNYRRSCRITLAELGDDVGLFGAAALVNQRL